MEQTDRDQRGGVRKIMVERRGRDQRTCMNDPQTWTTVRELTIGGDGQRKAKGEKLGQL